MRPERYNTVSILLHWLVAIGVAAQIAMGLSMTHFSLSTGRRFELYQLHKSIGITVLALVLVRVGWRATHPPPSLPDATPLAERRLAHGAHLLLYALLVGMPLTGWAVVSASPFNIPTVLYGVLPWPHLPVLPFLHNKKAVEAVLSAIHAYGGWFLTGLVGLHAAAALRHHLVLGDNVLWRMLPLGRRPSPTADPYRVPHPSLMEAKMNRAPLPASAGRKLGAILAAALVLVSTDPARAANWVVDAAHSRLGFSGVQVGAPFKGEFRKYDAKISFDPEHPESAHLVVNIDMASVRTGDAQRDEALPQADWFDVAKFPDRNLRSNGLSFERWANLGNRGETFRAGHRS